MKDADIQIIEHLIDEANAAKAEGNRDRFAQAIAQIFRNLPEREVLDIMRTWALSN